MSFASLHQKFWLNWIPINNEVTLFSLSYLCKLAYLQIVLNLPSFHWTWHSSSLVCSELREGFLECHPRRNKILRPCRKFLLESPHCVDMMRWNDISCYNFKSSIIKEMSCDRKKLLGEISVTETKHYRLMAVNPL